jgi:hypothetical protein
MWITSNVLNPVHLCIGLVREPVNGCRGLSVVSLILMSQPHIDD